VVVAGDFNGRVGPRELAGAGFTWATEAVKNTAGPFDFDHVLARGLCPAGAGAAEDETDASDHDPVWAVLAPCPGVPAAGGPRPGSAEASAADQDPAERAPLDQERRRLDHRVERDLARSDRGDMRRLQVGAQALPDLVAQRHGAVP